MTRFDPVVARMVIGRQPLRPIFLNRIDLHQ